MHVLQEDRHTTLVFSCLSVGHTINKEIVNDFLLIFLLYFQLVVMLLSRPADGTIRVLGQDGVNG